MLISRKLAPGTIAVTEGGEIYAALGAYTGIPTSFYRQPDRGYLYVYLMDSWHLTMEPEETREKLNDPAWVAREIRERAMFGIDGNACYTKSPKRFNHILHRVHFPEGSIPAHPWDLIPDPDRNPKGKEATACGTQ